MLSLLLTKYSKQFYLGSFLFLAFTSMFVFARPAYAVGIIELIQYGPVAFVSAFFSEVICDMISNFLSPLCQVLFDWSTDFMTIPYVNTIILGLQGLAIVAVIIIRVGIGITSGILLKGGNQEVSIGEYFFKTIVAIIIVALMPMLCRTVINFGTMLYQDIIGGAGSISDALSWFTIGDDIDFSGADEIGSLILWLMIGCLLIVILCFACGYQFVRRQIDMLVVSIIGPIVSVYAATENGMDQVTDLLKKLFGLCCIQWLQYILVEIALNFGIAWISSGAGNDIMTSVFYEGQSAQMFCFCIATFGAALTVPALVDQFTFGGGGSHIGSLVTGTIVGSAIRGAGRVPGNVAGGVARGAGAAVRRFR